MTPPSIGTEPRPDPPIAEDAAPRREYRVIWQREGTAKKRAFFQTLAGAEGHAVRQVNARGDMDWLEEPVPEITYGPIIESREVGPWTRS